MLSNFYIDLCPASYSKVMKSNRAKIRLLMFYFIDSLECNRCTGSCCFPSDEEVHNLQMGMCAYTFCLFDFVLILVYIV